MSCDQCKTPLKQTKEWQRHGLKMGRFECPECGETKTDRILDKGGDFTGMAYMEG